MVRTAELHARWDRRRARYQADLPLEARLRRASFRYETAKVERAWVSVSAHAAGLSVFKIAAAVGLGPTRPIVAAQNHDPVFAPFTPARANNTFVM